MGTFPKRSVLRYFLLFLILGIVLLSHTVAADGNDDGNNSTTVTTSTTTNDNDNDNNNDNGNNDNGNGNNNNDTDGNNNKNDNNMNTDTESSPLASSTLASSSSLTSGAATGSSTGSATGTGTGTADTMDGGHKHLVIFAGPHKTYETSIEEFFYTYASGRDEGPEDSALRGWIWPQPEEGDVDTINALTMNGLIKPHKIYQQLVINSSDQNDATDEDFKNVQEKLLDLLEIGFEQASRGIIIGSEEFDRVGLTPYTYANGIESVVKIKDRIGVTDHHITIVLLYKTPRIDQWLAIFNFELMEIPKDVDETQYDAIYREYICDPIWTDARWETLHTAMNTLHVAREYRAQGWDVVLIDVAGVKDANMDIEHVIGCQVLRADCDDDGWLVGLKGQTFEQNSKLYDSFGNRVFKSLSDKQEYDLENLFRLRDCNHKNDLTSDDDSGVEILYPKSIFMGCSDVNNPNLVTALQDPDFVLNAVRSQKDCGTEPMNLRDVLSGQSTVAEENPKNQHYHDQFKKFKIDDDAPNGNRKRRLWLIMISVFAIGGILYWKRHDIIERIDRTHQYGGMPFVIETPRMNNQRPLSVLT